MLHEKTFRFSRVGDADWVTMTGSYNASDTADTASYATMWQVTERPDIYDAFAKIAAQQRAQRTLARPYREFEGDDWSAYFLPSGPMRPAEDPVVARLARIPAQAELAGPDRDVLDVGRPREHARRAARPAVPRGSAGHVRGRPHREPQGARHHPPRRGARPQRLLHRRPLRPRQGHVGVVRRPREAPVLDLGRLGQLDHPWHGERPGGAGHEEHRLPQLRPRLLVAHREGRRRVRARLRAQGRGPVRTASGPPGRDPGRPDKLLGQRPCAVL